MKVQAASQNNSNREEYAPFSPPTVKHNHTDLSWIVLWQTEPQIELVHSQKEMHEPKASYGHVLRKLAKMS